VRVGGGKVSIFEKKRGSVRLDGTKGKGIFIW
jgi:hypothetical protein